VGCGRPRRVPTRGHSILGRLNREGEGVSLRRGRDQPLRRDKNERVSGVASTRAFAQIILEELERGRSGI